MFTRSRLATLACLAFLALLPFVLFAPVTLGGRSLVPFDNLYQWEPFKTTAAAAGVSRPQNHLLSDLILENYAWKQFIIQSLKGGELPLWNPYLFAGVPFLAAGQHSALYPLSILYYVLPLHQAYGWFTVLNLALAGMWMFFFMRTLGLKRASATFAAVAYEFSAFMIVSVVFPMIIAAAAWAPLILAMCERIIRRSPALGKRPASAPWALAGALAVAMLLLAGHVEIMVYTALIAAAYCAWRLVSLNLTLSLSLNRAANRVRFDWRNALRRSVWLAVMALLGAGMAAVQILPLLELVQTSFRSARSSFQEVLSYGFPARHILLWLMPNFYGNPAHHTVFDLFSWSTQAVNTASGNTEWGIKNYVEGGAYVGILTLIFAGIGVANAVAGAWRRRRGGAPGAAPAAPAARPPVWFFIVLALLSLAFMFGTLVYALLYYGLPGINQLNSPFRWVYAFTLCLATLAGVGMEALIARPAAEHRPSRPGRSLPSLLLRPPTLIWGLGLLILLGLAAVRFAWPAFEPLVTRIYLGMAKATDGFTSAAVFFSYEARNLAILAFLLIGCGALLAAARRAARPAWSAAAILLLAVDLSLAWSGFNPSVDPALYAAVPPAIEFLKQDRGPYRMTSYDPDGQKPLNANIPWLYGIADVRGYDSIIPKRYTDYMGLIEPQGELMYNRVAPLTQPGSLESPLLDLLNVKYVATTAAIATPGYTLVYDDASRGGALRIYQNERALPRAFTLPITSTLLTRDFSRAVQANDPRQYAMIDASCGITDTGCLIPYPAQYAPASITVYRNNEVWIDAQISAPSWLILADSYFPGWKAYVRPLGGRDDQEREVAVLPANGNFRAVRLEPAAPAAGDTLNSQALSPAGQPAASPTAYTVRFKYSPSSFQVGLFATFVSLMTLLFAAGIYLWRYAYRDSMTDSPVRRVAKNSAVLMGFNIGSRLIDFAFAALMARVLGPGGVGNFAFAVVIVSWFEIVMNFGLNTYLTRAVARDPQRANSYLYNTSILRLILSAVMAPVAALVILVWRGAFGLTPDTALAIILLTLAQVPSSLSAGLSALFFAHEKAEIPAALTIVSALLKVSIGTLALLSGLGIAGLAATSVVVSLATFAILLVAAARAFFVPRREGNPQLRREMARESFPLMLNHLLATLFFKVDVPLLTALQSAAVVGWYSTAYKFVDAFNIVPAFFTQSFFPVMSRMAAQGGNALARSYTLALKLLVILAMPLAVFTSFASTFLVGVLGGPEFLPHGATALTIMIWSIPFGWINSVTNYALIAVDRQHALTRAFIIGLTFNVAANLVFIPLYSYQAAAVITILSEIIEGAAFYFYVRRHIAPIHWPSVLARPALAAAAMALMTWVWAAGGLTLVGLFYGCIVYGVVLWLAGGLTAGELEMLAPLAPARLRRILAVG